MKKEEIDVIEFIQNLPSTFWVVASTIFILGMGIMAMIMRQKSAKKPANAKKIMIPPLAMSTGALMFLFPFFRVTFEHLWITVLIGVACSTILIKTSKFEVEGQDIYLKPSKAFVFVLVALLILRTIAKIYLGGTFHLGELGGIFFILAYSMLLPWRLAMLLKFNKLKKQLPKLA